MVAYRNLDTNRFVAHMNYEHGAYFDMEFLLAACLMDEEERKAVRNVMELKHKAQQEKGREGEERRGEKRPLIVEQRKETVAPPPPPAPRQIPPSIPVKEEVPDDEVRAPPEKWEGPKTKPSFTCGVCDKTFLLLKYLQAHQKKACHSSPSPSPPSPVIVKPQEIPRPPSAPEFKCGQCQYTGSRERDLRLHVTKKHGGVPGTPPPPSPTLLKPSSAPGPDTVFSSLSNSWTKNKEISKDKEAPKEKEASVDKERSKNKSVKSEPKEASLEELTESVGDKNDSMETEEDPDDPDPAEEDQGSSPVEDTTFISFDTEASSTSPVTSQTEEEDATLQVDVGKSKYFKANPQTVSVQVDAKVREQYDVIDDKLPAGWKVREIEHEFKSGKKETKRHYLTPDHKALKTGLAVLEYMRLSSRYSAKEIMDYAKYLAVPVNRLEKYMELYL